MSTSPYPERTKARPLPSELTANAQPSSRTRLLLTLSFPLLFLLALPFWWYTTSIERLPLPTDRIEALSHAPWPEPFTQVLLTANSATFPPPQSNRAQFTTRDLLVKVSEEITKGVDGILKQQRPAERGKRRWEIVLDVPRGKPSPLRIHIDSSNRANTSFPLEPHIQPPERGVMTSRIPAGTLVIPIHPDQTRHRLLRDHLKIALIKSLNTLLPLHREPPPIPLRALKYKPAVTLSFVLLNEDATTGSYVRSWDIDGALRDHFAPHLEALKGVFDFTIESQILFHAPLSFEPTFGQPPRGTAAQALIDAAGGGEDGAEEKAMALLEEEKEGWLIDEEEMKVFVNSEKWSLDSGSTNNPVLRFLLFVPSERHRPMRIAVPDTAPSFLIPQYGSVAILNPPPSTPSDPSLPTTFDLPLASLTPSFHLFTQHLYSLLALPVLPSPPIHPPPPPSPLLPPSLLLQPLSPWQLHEVLVQRTRENTEEARKTLSGIVRLVGKIGEMKVGEGVRGMVLGAVERLEQMNKTRDAMALFLLSKEAVGLADEAFFDPSMMGLLYFPDEHKFAVYTPLFAPVGVPLLIGLLRELYLWRKRRAARRVMRAGSMPSEKNEEPEKQEDGRGKEKAVVGSTEAVASRDTRSSQEGLRLRSGKVAVGLAGPTPSQGLEAS